MRGADVRAPDLRRIAARRDGAFPAEEIGDWIDGRAEAAGERVDEQPRADLDEFGAQIGGGRPCAEDALWISTGASGASGASFPLPAPPVD